MTLVAIIELPHATRKNSVKKILHLRCNYCSHEWERGWYRQTAEQPLHFCTSSHSAQYHSARPERNELVSKNTKAAMQKPEVRAAHMAKINERSTNPELNLKWRNNVSIAAIKRLSDPKQRAAHSERIKKKFEDPEFRARFTELQNTPEIKLFRSQRMLTFWSDPENRNKLSGANSYLSGKVNKWWITYSNTPDYRWSQEIKKLSNFSCTSCGSCDKLESHHVAPRSMYPELQYDINNGIALCFKCHRASHALLKNDPIAYEESMKVLVLKRDV